MQPSEEVQKSGGGEPSSNGHVQQYANAVVSERSDALVYGYLRRMGYTAAADGMERESPFLGGSVARTNSRTIITINDRIHDHTLEQIVQLFLQEGRFGLNPNLQEFGEELRRLTNRFTTITSGNSPGRSQMHQQLYGRPTYSRPTQQNYTLRMAPQARAQLELQHIAQIGERRFREEQQQAHFKQMQMQMLEQQLAQQQNLSTVGADPLPSHQQYEDANMSQSAGNEGASRRKPQQPQSYKEKLKETLVDPIVGFINDRTWNEVDNFHLDDNDAFLNVIDKDFLAMYDYEQQSNGVEQRFEELMASPRFEPEEPQNLHFDASALPVEDEIVLETSAKPYYHFPNPSPLLSPLPKEMTFKRNVEPPLRTVLHQRPSKPIDDPKPSLKKTDSSKHHGHTNGSREKLDEKEKERKERKSGEKSSRNESPRRSTEDHKKRSDEKKRQREKEREREMSTSREKRKEEHATASVKSAKNKPIVQSDRESTSSSSSRPFSSDAADSSVKKDSEKRRKEKEERRRVEKEKDRARTLPPMSLSVDSKQGSDMLQKVRKSHAAGTQSRQGTHPVREPSTSKRKADEMLSDKKDFKIPKKASSSSKPELKAVYGSSFQSGPLIRETVPQPSSSSSSKREKESSNKETVLCDGEGRPDATHFITPRGHLARPSVSSMFVNFDKGYEAFQQGLGKHKKNSKIVVTEDDAISDITVSPSSGSNRYKTGDPATSTELSKPVARPNRPKTAPQKGFLLNKSPSETPSSEDSSTDSEKESPDEEDNIPQTRNSRNDSGSPEPKKACREIDMDRATALLNRIHGNNGS